MTNNDLAVGEVVEVNVVFPPYNMPEDFPTELPPGQEDYGWIRARVTHILGSDLVWLDFFGKRLSGRELPPGSSGHYDGIYNAIVKRVMIRKLSALDRMAAET